MTLVARLGASDSLIRPGLSVEFNATFEKGLVEIGPVAEGRADEAGPVTEARAVEDGTVTEARIGEAGPVTEARAVEDGTVTEARAVEGGPITERRAAEPGPITEGRACEAGAASLRLLIRKGISLPPMSVLPGRQTHATPNVVISLPSIVRETVEIFLRTARGYT
jgi:hypothetical protein